MTEASAWHIASEHDDMDWDGFQSWLDADPRHRIAYDEVALADLRLQELTPRIGQPTIHANDEVYPDGDHAPSLPRARSFARFRWAGAAIAASLVALLAVPQLINGEPQVYETAESSRTIQLADGSSVMLAPHSSLSVEDDEQQMALSGGAWFDIRHDPARQLTIAAGDVTITDIGTQFDVQDAAGRVRVAVGQGSVSVASKRLSAPVTLPAGRGMTFDPNQGTAVVRPVRQGDAGGWRTGRLSYESAPLALVAADLSRYSNLQVSVDEPLRDRKFSGTLSVENGEMAIRDLSQLMGVSLDRSGGHSYRLVPAKR